LSWIGGDDIILRFVISDYDVC